MVRKTKSIIALLIASALLIFEGYWFISLFHDEKNSYLYTRIAISSFEDVLYFIISLIIILGLIFLIYLILRRCKLLIVIVLPCLVALIVLNAISALFFLPVDSDSYTNDVENYMILDQQAEAIIENVSGREFFNFENGTVKDYCYNYKSFPISHSFVYIDSIVELTEEEYNAYFDKISRTFVLTQDTTYSDSEGGIRYIVNFNDSDNHFIMEYECTLTFYEATNEVKICFYIKYDT